jgi:hypothetical protein
MAIPLSGPLSLTNIQTEFGGTNPIGLNEYYRNGGRVPNAPQNSSIPTSGAISIGNFYGATNRIPVGVTISSPVQNYDVYTNRGPSYVAGISNITVTVGPGVYVGSASTGAYAMYVPSAFSSGDTITIVNNGVIEGTGGDGGPGPFAANPGGTGGGGGPALYIAYPTTIQNNSVIAGGGGGGGGGAGVTPNKGPSYWGGGGGGGAGYNPGSGGGGAYPGGAGSLSSGGGGAGAPFTPGGSGGGLGSPGAGGSATGGANPRPGGPGGAAGYYIVGGGYVTWTAYGTLYGPAA